MGRARTHLLKLNGVFESRSCGACTTGVRESPRAFSFSVSPNGALLYIVELGHRVRVVVVATGVIQTLAGNGVGAFSGDGVSKCSELCVQFESLNYATFYHSRRAPHRWPSYGRPGESAST